MVDTAHIWRLWCACRETCKEKQMSISSSGECQCRKWSDQQEQLYRERSYGRGSAKTSHYKDDHTWALSGAKPEALVYRDVEKGDMVRWVILLHDLHTWVRACVAYTKSRLSAGFTKIKWKRFQDDKEWTLRPMSGTANTKEYLEL